MPAAPIQFDPTPAASCPTYREELQTVQLLSVVSSRRLPSLLAVTRLRVLRSGATGDEGSPECWLFCPGRKGPCTGPVEAAVGVEGLWDDWVGGWFESNESWVHRLWCRLQHKSNVCAVGRLMAIQRTRRLLETEPAAIDSIRGCGQTGCGSISGWRLWPPCVVRRAPTRILGDAQPATACVVVSYVPVGRSSEPVEKPTKKTRSLKPGRQTTLAHEPQLCVTHRSIDLHILNSFVSIRSEQRVLC